MTCVEARESFGFYLYDEMETAQRRAIESHVRACPECRAELETERRFVNALAQRMREISEDVRP